MSAAPRSPGEWAGRRVAVLGAARSGVAAANLLAELGAEVVLSDTRPLDAIDTARLDPRVSLRGGQNDLADCEFVVPSPGIPPGAAIFAAARAAGMTLVGEVELAAALASAPIVAITGTDGKSTTTEMIGAVCRAAGRPTVVGGNIGIPLSEDIRTIGSDGIVVAEVSAFQLWSCGTFRPRVAVVTNVAPDHADYFEGDWAAYVAAKARVLRDQGAGDTAILRGDDPVVAAMETPAGVRRVLFGPEPGFEWGWDGAHLLRAGEPVMASEELGVPGRHNVCNALATLATVDALGLPLGPALEALRRFRGLPHRMESIRTVGGVQFIDDSKATNPHAARVGLRSLTVPYVAIVGGYDKGLDQAEFVDELRSHARAVVVIGGTADRTARELGPGVRVIRADTMEAAVGRAAEVAAPGDAVVLSPAASSFDLYRDYHERGQRFQAAVRALPEA
ncbi:UDP-N-acetylmuramoyl-L-alanine--D-glutamate ligase [Myxococcota bacterium]|nr:UDP-N-acetylmuramoyl-L-alanine--D-glutamate ligase [Myxococcota bacterium]